MIHQADCIFETYVEPLGPEFGSDAGRIHPGVCVTHVPTGTVVRYNLCPLELDNRRHALNKLTNVLASPEQQALVEAMAGVHLHGDEHRTNNDAEHEAAAAILEGLELSGWELVKAEQTGRNRHV